MKQLDEIGIFIQKCKINYSFLLQNLKIKHVFTDDKDEDQNDSEENFHDLEKPQFQCAKCDKTFYLKKHLLFHIKGHSETRPYKCLNCSLCFKYKQNLLQHKLLHSTHNLYKCHICGKGK